MYSRRVKKTSVEGTVRRVKTTSEGVGSPQDVEVPTRENDSYMEVGVSWRGMFSYLREMRAPTRGRQVVRVPTYER